MHTNVWNLNPDQPFKQSKKFVVDLSMIDSFNERQKSYKGWKRKFLENSDVTIVYYEDMNPEDNFKKIIEDIGFDYDNRNILRPPQKMYSLSDKENIIINIDEIKNLL